MSKPTKLAVLVCCFALLLVHPMATVTGAEPSWNLLIAGQASKNVVWSENPRVKRS